MNFEEIVHALTKVRELMGFDWKVMWTYNIDLNIEDDTYILQYLIDVRAAKATKKLKELAKIDLGIDMIELDDFFPARGGKKARISFDILPFESVRSYGPADADITLALYRLKRPQLPDSLKFIYAVEIKLMKYLAKVEYYGIKLDMDLLLKMKADTEREKDELEQEIYKVAGKTFAINSAKQLGDIMFKDLKYPIIAYTSSGQPATGKGPLEMLSRYETEDGSKMYPLADLLLNYKGKEKLISAFFNKLLRENIDGYIFPRYNQAGTESGRIAGYSPNLKLWAI